ncbi:hypothetical protein SLS56_000145 [Neofusicoccum ribis]|uniref:HMG box domain-containing protein n=1 Tax=Neofusicoccum ribis TaxID=45134 RepID=A0ABR3TFV2_9PEZI
MSAELSDTLNRLRLQDYLPALVENGFDSWDVVCDITEEDLAHLGFKLGHRRILQREIAASRGVLGADSNGPSPHTMTPPENHDAQSPASPRVEERTKRRYRRKPRPDINAPQKPKTAYVNFADNLRTDPAISSLSFVDIAREVGRRWQALPPEQKHTWECQAARDMQEYEAQMDEYKTTENYRRYQNYLKAFRQDQFQGTRSRSTPKSSVDQDRKSRSNSSETLSNASGGAISRSNSGSREYDDCQAAVDLALQELSVRRDEVLASGVPIFDARTLPPEDVIRKAATSCSLGTGSLFFLIREEHLEEMLDHIYSQESIEPLSLIVVLLMAAIGAHYDVECMSDSMRHGLFASATLIFDSEFSRPIDYRAMWVFTLLSVHSLLEKHMVARHVVAAGLQISRSKSRVLEDDAPELVRAWSLLMRSTSVTDAIYYQASKIGLVSREIAEVTVHRAANAVRTEHIELLTEKLDAWYKALPPNMHLAALTDENKSSYLTYYQRRAILMMLDQELSTIEEDFAYAKVCVDILCTCSTVEPVAANHLSLIQPLYDALVDKKKRLQIRPPCHTGIPVYQGTLTSSASFPSASSVQSESPQEAPLDAQSRYQSGAATLDLEIVSIVKKLSDLLADPFSMGLKAKIQGVRETSNAVGTYSVLWWK